MSIMPPHRDFRSIDPFGDTLDAVLAEVAINVQLPPGLHAKAGDRYASVRAWIERPGSPLHGQVRAFYPQGSMAIDATISTRGTDDEYDIDIICEVDARGETAQELMDLLETALAGYPQVRIRRQSRCMTLYYADGMHLDITPARRSGVAEKVSEIVHHKHDSDEPGRFVLMNAWGFVDWYRNRTPTEERFALALNRRLYEEAGIAFAAADVDEVPPQTPLVIKSVATVALQLLKRHRNIAYADATGRIPPSILLSCHAGQASSPGMGLADMVIRQARWTARAITEAERSQRLLSVANPVYAVESFTDRWPESHAQQRGYARLLDELADGLEAARSGVQLEDLQAWLRVMFGDRVVTRSVEAFNERIGRQVKDRQHGFTRGGGLFVPAKPALIGVAAGLAPVAARAHTNMGEHR